MWLAENLDVFFGRCTDVVTDVYAQAPREAPWLPPLRLTGRITGPYCAHTRTVPATTRFVDLGDGPTLLARASVPDLAPWSPEHPHLYRLTVELCQGDHVVDRANRIWGCHRLGVYDGSLVVGSRPWVLVAVRRTQPEIPAARWADLRVAAVVESPDVTWLEEASVRGTVTVCYVPKTTRNITAQLRFYARFACAWLTIVADGTQSAKEWQRHAPNLPLATCGQLSDDRPHPASLTIWPMLPADEAATILTATLAVRRRAPENLPDEEAAAQAIQWAADDQYRSAGYIVW